jgi:hypothetical protein
MDFCNTEEFPHAILRKLILQLWVFSFYNKQKGYWMKAVVLLD